MVHYSDQFQVRIHTKGERDLFPCRKRINKMAASRIFYGNHLLQSRLFLFHGPRILLWMAKILVFGVSIILKPCRKLFYFILLFRSLERKHPQARLRLYIFFLSRGSSSLVRKVNRLLLKNKQIKKKQTNRA